MTATSQNAVPGEQGSSGIYPGPKAPRILITLAVLFGLALAGVLIWATVKLAVPDQAPIEWRIIFYTIDGKVMQEGRCLIIDGTDRGVEFLLTYRGEKGKRGQGFLKGHPVKPMSTGAPRAYAGTTSEPGWVGGKFYLEINEQGIFGQGHWSTPTAPNPKDRQGGAIQVIMQPVERDEIVLPID